MAEGRRYIAQKVLKVNGEIVTDAMVDINVNDTVSIGKHKEFTVTEEMLKVLDG
jgi:RNA-binding protein YlmH